MATTTAHILVTISQFHFDQKHIKSTLRVVCLFLLVYGVQHTMGNILVTRCGVRLKSYQEKLNQVGCHVFEKKTDVS